MSLNKPDHSMISDLPASVTTDTANASNISSGVLKVAQGGTGQSTYTEKQLLVGESNGSLGKYTLTAGDNVNLHFSGDQLILDVSGGTGGGGGGGTGATGATGVVGGAGPTGASGASGINGVTGSTGIRGPAGISLAGATGAIGVTGATGAAGGFGTIGATGATGLAGPAGATGLVGATGTAGKGATGASGVAAPLSIACTRFTGNGALSEFGPITGYVGTDPLRYFVTINGVLQDPDLIAPTYTISEINTRKVIFNNVPADNAKIAVRVFGQSGSSEVPKTPVVLGPTTLSTPGTYTVNVPTGVSSYIISAQAGDGVGGTGTNGQDGQAGVSAYIYTDDVLYPPTTGDNGLDGTSTPGQAGKSISITELGIYIAGGAAGSDGTPGYGGGGSGGGGGFFGPYGTFDGAAGRSGNGGPQVGGGGGVGANYATTNSWAAAGIGEYGGGNGGEGGSGGGQGGNGQGGEGGKFGGGGGGGGGGFSNGGAAASGAPGKGGYGQSGSPGGSGESYNNTVSLNGATQFTVVISEGGGNASITLSPQV